MTVLDIFSAAAFVFDKDGTLIDTESIWYAAYERWLATYGASHRLEEHQVMMGADARESIQILQARHASLPQGEESMIRLLQEREQIFHEMRAQMGLRLQPGVQPFLDICERKGMTMAMATNATKENTDTELTLLNWKERFAAVVTADDVARTKPAPDVYLETARRLGVNPSDCIAFEDGVRGVQSAHVAGMKVVFIRDPRFLMPVPSEADIVVESFEELTDLE